MSAIETEIQQIVAGFEGEIAVAAKDLLTGASVSYHADTRCPTASVIKLPILLHTLLLAQEGALTLEDPLTLREEDKVPGSGILTQMSVGLTMPLRDACMLMIALSDNTATNLILDRVGIEPVNTRMQELGFTATKLFARVFRPNPVPSEENKRYGLGVTTPRDQLHLLESIQNGSLFSGEVGAQARQFMAAQHYRDGIPRLLPPEYKFQGKSGAVDAVRNDVGLLTIAEGHEIALAIFCQKIPVVLWTVDNPGLLAIAQLSKALVTHFVENVREKEPPLSS